MQRRKRRRVVSDNGSLEHSKERRLAMAAKGVSKEQLKRIAAAAGIEVSTYRLYEAVARDAEPLLYQEQLLIEGGGTKAWDLFDPTLLVQHVLSKSQDLAETYKAKLAEKPGPWHIIVGFDEHIPGDKLKTKNRRKCMVLAFNFAELGEEVLQRDCTWFIPVVFRSTEMEDVLAGWSQALKLLLRRFLLHETGPRNGGIPFTVSGETFVLRATVTDIITDGDGHRQGLEWIGASGLKPCLLHCNVFGKRSEMEGGEDVLITCHEPHKFVRNDNNGVYECADYMLAAKKCGKRDASQRGGEKIYKRPQASTIASMDCWRIGSYGG